MKKIILLIKKNSPVSYVLIAIAVLIGIGTLNSYINPEGIYRSYERMNVRVIPSFF